MISNKIKAAIYTAGVTAVVTKLVTDYFPNVLEYIKSTLSTIAGWFTNTHPVEGYYLLLALLIIPFANTVFKHLSKEQEIPYPYNYTSDTIDGILWRWKYRNNRIVQLTGYCPKCEGDIVPKQNCSSFESSVVLHCEHCTTPYMNLPLPLYATYISEAVTPYHDRVEREVLRRIRIKEKEFTSKQ